MNHDDHVRLIREGVLGGGIAWADLGSGSGAFTLALADLLVRRGARAPSLFIDCGSDDGFVDQNRALHSELTRLGVAHAYAEWPGAHTWRYWSTHVAESLAWMGGRIGR